MSSPPRPSPSDEGGSSQSNNHNTAAATSGGSNHYVTGATAVTIHTCSSTDEISQLAERHHHHHQHPYHQQHPHFLQLQPSGDDDNASLYGGDTVSLNFNNSSSNRRGFGGGGLSLHTGYGSLAPSRHGSVFGDSALPDFSHILPGLYLASYKEVNVYVRMQRVFMPSHHVSGTAAPPSHRRSFGQLPPFITEVTSGTCSPTQSPKATAAMFRRHQFNAASGEQSRSADVIGDGSAAGGGAAQTNTTGAGGTVVHGAGSPAGSLGSSQGSSSQPTHTNVSGNAGAVLMARGGQQQQLSWSTHTTGGVTGGAPPQQLLLPETSNIDMYASLVVPGSTSERAAAAAAGGAAANLNSSVWNSSLAGGNSALLPPPLGSNRHAPMQLGSDSGGGGSLNVTARRPPAVVHWFLCCATAAEAPTPNFEQSLDPVLRSTIAEDRFLRLPFRDATQTTLKDHFQTAFDFIDRALSSCSASSAAASGAAAAAAEIGGGAPSSSSSSLAGGPPPFGSPDHATPHVVVYCQRGISRSPSVIIGYLMTRRGYTYEAANDIVRRAREVADPNAGFVYQLTMASGNNPNSDPSTATGSAPHRPLGGGGNDGMYASVVDFSASAHSVTMAPMTSAGSRIDTPPPVVPLLGAGSTPPGTTGGGGAHADAGAAQYTLPAFEVMPPSSSRAGRRGTLAPTLVTIIPAAEESHHQQNTTRLSGHGSSGQPDVRDEAAQHLLGPVLSEGDAGEDDSDEDRTLEEEEPSTVEQLLSAAMIQSSVSAPPSNAMM